MAAGDAPTYTLPDLPYGYDALEPHIDEATMHVHHDKHHAGYTTKMNAALTRLREIDPEMGAKSIDELLQNLDKVPEEVRGGIRNAGGGYVNHALYWTIMGPGKGGPADGAVGEAITAKWGSFEAFKTEFTKAAATCFGSGWAWLYVDKTGDAPELKICATANQDTPANEAGKVPILTCDVWEHAYYLKVQNRRPDYISNWWNVVNWEEVNRRYAEAQ